VLSRARRACNTRGPRWQRAERRFRPAAWPINPRKRRRPCVSPTEWRRWRRPVAPPRRCSARRRRRRSTARGTERASQHCIRVVCRLDIARMTGGAPPPPGWLSSRCSRPLGGLRTPGGALRVRRCAHESGMRGTGERRAAAAHAAKRTRSPADVRVQKTPQLRSFCQSQSGAAETAASPRLGAAHQLLTLYLPLGRSGQTSRPSSDTSTRKSCGPSACAAQRASAVAAQKPAQTGNVPAREGGRRRAAARAARAAARAALRRARGPAWERRGNARPACGRSADSAAVLRAPSASVSPLSAAARSVFLPAPAVRVAGAFSAFIASSAAVARRSSVTPPWARAAGMRR